MLARHLIASVLVAMVAPAPAFGQNVVRSPGGLAAFPGAEGFGAETPGGRGGRLITVTNLNSEGPGSLRQALREKGPRIVVFGVGGTITLEKDINIEEPFVTIAGQTAPGDGICLRGAALRIRTHDVVVRHLRVRVGDDTGGPDPDNRDGIGISNDRAAVHHVVLDHCSISWAIDENIQLWTRCHDITIQWCLIAEALEHSLHPKGAHGMGLLVGDHARRISIHHNLFAHNMDRNPLLKGDTEAEVINNIVYNWRWFATGLTDPEGSGPQRADILANVYLAGPQTNNRFGVGLERNLKPGSTVHLRGNLGPGREQDRGDEWATAMSRGKNMFRRETPALPGIRLQPEPAGEARTRVLEGAGATRPRRDAVDERIVQSVKAGSGKIIDSPREVGGWPVYRGGEAPVDSDHDGLPDVWERAHGLNPASAADGVHPAPSGYTWIEEYLHSLAR